MSDDSNSGEGVALVTRWANHESPSEYHAFTDRDAALAWLEERGVDTDDLEHYTSPGGPHESVKDPNDERWNYSIRTVEIEDV